MRIPQSFFYKALKPGRYVGADLFDAQPPPPGQRRVVWFYPGRYEDAAADPGYRRGFFTLRANLEAHVERAVDFAQDAWDLLVARELPPFTIDSHDSIQDADAVVFWIADVFAAARIPSLLTRLNLDRSRTRIGAVINGCWAPPWLKNHVDWISPAPYGWLPESIKSKIDHSEVGADQWESIADWSPDSMPLLSYPLNNASRWLPIIETGSLNGHLELLAINNGGQLVPRAVSDCVDDALATLRATGVEGLRLHDSGWTTGMQVPTILMELTRVYNMARLQVDLPPVPAGEFHHRWRVYKPHLIRPILKLQITSDDDPQAALDAGRDALNDGWRGLTLVASFDSFAQFSALVPAIETVVSGWSKAASGFDDRRPLRVQYNPAPIERWVDPPADPSEDDMRRLLYECRHLAESVGSNVSVGAPRLEHVIARNWLAATSDDIWDNLATLNLSDSNDESALPFDWLGWTRNRSGMKSTPTTPFLRGALPAVSTTSDAEHAPEATRPTAVATTGDQLYGRRKRRAPVSRRLQAPARNRLRVCWGKSERWRFFSHLDMVRVVERAIRQAGLPVSYSEGFHPRMKVSFGPPLSFGLTSRAELFDIVMDRNVEDSDASALGDAFPDGVTLIQAEGLPSQVPSLTESINEAEYSAMIPFESQTAQSLIEAFLQQPTIQFTRPDRPDRKPFDPRATLRSTEMEILPDGVRWNIRLALAAQGQIRPAEWARLIFGLTDDQLGDLVIERTALRVRRSNQVHSAFDTVNA